MDQKEFDRLLERYLQGNASESEKALVHEWYHRITPSEMPFRRGESAGIRKRLQAALDENKGKTKANTEPDAPVYPMWTRFALPAAACFVLIVISVFLLLATFRDAVVKSSGIAAPEKRGDWIITVNNAVAPRFIALDDGSEIILSPGGALEYPSRFDIHKREVRLQKGSAFFRIEKDTIRPFNVYAAGVVTRVLGTSFRINTYEQGRVTVDVKTGTVKVYTREDTSAELKTEEVILSPNQRADYDPESHKIVRTLVEKPRVVIPSREVENMTFDRAPVASVLHAVEKAYEVEIRFDSVKLSSCALTTHLIPDEDLYTRLKIICEAIDASYVLVDGYIVITGKGC